MKRIVTTTLLSIIALISYCQTSNLLQLVAKFQKTRVELDRTNPYDDPESCTEKSTQIIDLYNQIYIIDSTYIEPYTLYIPYCMMAYSYYGQKKFKESIPYLEKAKAITEKYHSQILQTGINEEGRIGIWILLRDAYEITGDISRSLLLAKEISSACEDKLPRKAAVHKREEGLLYKKNGDIAESIRCIKTALDLYERLGNEVSGFYAGIMVNDILELYLQIPDYNNALSFVDNNRERFNNLFIGNDDQEYEYLNQTNKYLYQIYQYKGMYMRAVNAASLVSNFYKLAEGDKSINHACWINNAACSFLDLYESEDNIAFLNQADSLFNVAGQIWEVIPQRDSISDYATYLGNYGNLLSSMKKYEEAEKIQMKSINLYKLQGAPPKTLLSAMNRLATIKGNSGRTNEALSLYQKLYNEYMQMNDTIQLARICNLMSQTYWIDLNDNELAERYANQAVDLINSSNNNSVLSAYILENAGRIYYRLGLEKKGLDNYARAIDIKLSLGVAVSPYEMLNLYEFYVDSYSDVLYYFPQGKEDVLTKIEGYCHSLLDNNQGTSYEEKKLQWKTRTVLAKAYMFFRKFKEAENEYNDLLKIEEELWGLNSDNYITSLNNLAYCYGLWGDHKKCREISLKCVELDPTHKNYENILSSSIALNDIKMVEKYLPLTFNASLDYLKSQFMFLSAEQREDIIERGMSVGFSNLSLAAFAYPDNDICAEYAYNSALVYKGLLLSTQNDIELAVESSNNPALKSKYQELKQLQNQLQQASDSTNVVSIRRSIELQEKEILSSLRVCDDYTKNLNLTYKDVHHKLKDGDVAIEFVELDKSLLAPEDTSIYYGAIVLKKDWAAPKFVLLSGKGEVDTVVKDMITEFNEANGYQGEEWISVSKHLYHKIWEPISALLQTTNCIYFSPVGMLSLIPMEILQDSNGQVIDDQYKMYRMSTTKNLCLVRHPTNKTHAVLFGGLVYDGENSTSLSESNSPKKRDGWQYLPSTAEEIADIGAILHSNNISYQVYDKLSGSEESFKSLSGKPVSLIHLATHGFYLNEDESDTFGFFHDMKIKINRGANISTLLRSGLMFSNGQRAWLYGKKDIPQDIEDGILLASEISLLDLQSVDLVTLSACQTGLGDISDDGVLGLQRGFKRAGVNSLLMTLWPVEDSATKIFMKQFYNNLFTGYSKQQSLQTAQKYLREYNNGYYNEPKYWAAFILLDGIEKN